MRALGLLIATLALTPAATMAQVTVVDEGSFAISRGGAPLGRETFSIRRAASALGMTYIATGTVDLGATRLSPALRADSAFSPIAYQIEARDGSAVQEQLRGIVARGRFSAQVRTPAGESTKEYIVSPGAVVLDEDVFHHYYFLAQRAARLGAAGGSIPVIIPRRSAQQVMRVRPQGDDRLTIGGQAIAARVYVLTGPGTAAGRVWVDGQGRVLKVALDAGGVVAVREGAPR